MLLLGREDINPKNLSKSNPTPLIIMPLQPDSFRLYCRHMPGISNVSGNWVTTCLPGLYGFSSQKSPFVSNGSVVNMSFVWGGLWCLLVFAFGPSSGVFRD